MTLIIAMICLVILAYGQLRLTNQSQDAATERSDIKTITEQIASCVEPTGECSKRGAASQATAVGFIVKQQAIDTCKAVFLEQPDKVFTCIRLLEAPETGTH